MNIASVAVSTTASQLFTSNLKSTTQAVGQALEKLSTPAPASAGNPDGDGDGDGGGSERSAGFHAVA